MSVPIVYSATMCSPQRVLDVNVSVERYGTQVQYWRGGAHDVYGGPYVAEFRAEYPIAQQIVDQRKCHDQRTDKQVGDGQRGEEKVSNSP